MMSERHIEIASNEEISQYSHEFTLLCDRLNVCDEIREGYYSDESWVRDLFSTCESRDSMASQVAALDLPGITPRSDLIDALRAIRQLWTNN